MKFAVVIPTYNSENAKKYLLRSIYSVLNQTYKDFHLFIIFDGTVPEAKIPEDPRITVQMSTLPPERVLFKDNIKKIRNWGGINASNFGVNLATRRGFNYIARLDHDDYWESNHLQCLKDTFESDSSIGFVCTMGRFLLYNLVLPNNVPRNGSIVDFIPRPANVLHSSICIDYNLIPFQYSYSFQQMLNALPEAGDANLLKDVVNALFNNPNIKSKCNTTITVHHETEGGTK
jgi:glycosyltransferase involved in cell wall biosynthesis